jgi:hypothetical protein
MKNDRNFFKTINVDINDQNIIFMTRRQRNILNKTFLIRVHNITRNIRSYAKLMILFMLVFNSCEAITGYLFAKVNER